MREQDFEGSLVLERLAAIDAVDAFFDAVDADDVERATALLRRAKIDAPTLSRVVQMILAGDGER